MYIIDCKGNVSWVPSSGTQRRRATSSRWRARSRKPASWVTRSASAGGSSGLARSTHGSPDSSGASVSSSRRPSQLEVNSGLGQWSDAQPTLAKKAKGVPWRINQVLEQGELGALGQALGGRGGYGLETQPPTQSPTSNTRATVARQRPFSFACPPAKLIGLCGGPKIC